MKIEEKIKTLEELREISQDLKKQNKRIVHCHGVFDIVHYGHIKHFTDAKEQGDILIVTITPDRFIQKGPGRPFFNEEIRLNHLANLECIDYVSLNKWPTAVETIKVIQPDIFAKGQEVLNNKDVDRINTGVQDKSNLSMEEDAVKGVGGRLYLTDEVTFSSSRIINQITSSISEDAKKYLSDLKSKYSIEDINNILDSLEDSKVLLIGDSILDEYVYCNVLGISSKNPLVAYKYAHSKTSLGGALYIANTLSSFVKSLSLISCIGEDRISEVYQGLNSNIEKNLFVQKGSKTLVKKRYLNEYSNQKIFEVYNTDSMKINDENEEEIIRYLDHNLKRFDTILISDFGHGLISDRIRDYLSSTDKFLAINSQLNAGNQGYNFITNYKRADFVSLNEREIRFPLQEKDNDIKVPIKKIKDLLKVNKVNVTLGKSGTIYFQDDEYYFCPTFTKDPLDTTGAGDVVLAISSLLAGKNSNPQVIPFFANSIGAIATKILGNERIVNKNELKKFINYLLK